MNLNNDIKPISYIKTHAADMLKFVNNTHRPIIVTQNGEARGVLLDTESYQDMINALSLLKIMAQSEKDIDENKIIPQNEVFNELKLKYVNERKK